MLLLLLLLLLWLLRCVASFIYDLTSCLCQKEAAQSATRRELGAMQSLAQLHKVEIKFSTRGGGGKRGLCGVSSGCGNLRCNCREEAPNQDVVARPGKFFDTNNTQSPPVSVCVSVCVHILLSLLRYLFLSAFFSLDCSKKQVFLALVFLLASFGSGDKPTLQLQLLLFSLLLLAGI